MPPPTCEPTPSQPSPSEARTLSLLSHGCMPLRDLSPRGLGVGKVWRGVGVGRVRRGGGDGAARLPTEEADVS